MKRPLLFFQVLVFLWASAAQPAHAHIGVFFDWLGELSGPGPFQGFGADLNLFCWGIVQRPAKDANGAVIKDQDGRIVFADDAILPRGRFRCESSSQKTIEHHYGGPVARDDIRFVQDRLSLSVGLFYNHLWTTENNLSYSTELAALEPRLDGELIVPTLNVGVHRAVDIGVGAGVLWFHGPRLAHLTEGTRVKFAFQPLRVAVRPFVVFERRPPGPNTLQGLYRRLSSVQYVLTATVLPGWEAKDFGATGPFRVGPELIWNAGISFDPFRFFDWPKQSEPSGEALY